MLLTENKTVALKKLETALPKKKIKKIVYRFNQELDGACEIEINDIDCQSVMLRGDPQQIEPAWVILQNIIGHSQVEPEEDEVEEESEIVAEYNFKKHDNFCRPSEITESDLINRFEDGSLFLTGAAAQLMEIIDQKITPFIEQEQASHFYSQPIWHEDQLKFYGYPENSKDLCKIGHFDEITAIDGEGGKEYWQNATCDNIWRSLKNATIDKPITYTTAGTCCRNETRSYYFLERLKTFRMREVVMAGDRENILAFRERAIEFVTGLAESLELDAILEKANDPFFLEDGSTEKDVPEDIDLPDCVKYEFRPSLYDEKSLACASFNVHGNFFSKGFNYQNSQQEMVWTSCAAFGIERWVWAILVQHGSDPEAWPETLKDALPATSE